MRIKSAVSVALGFGLLISLAYPGTAEAAEITVLCSNGLQAVMEEFAPQFERATGHKVVVRFGLAADLKRRIDSGEAFDMAVLTPPLIDDAIKNGKVASTSRTVIARSGLGLVIRAGGRKADISSTESFKRTLLNAKSITYAKEGASGVYFAGLVQRLGIAEDLKSKTILGATAGEIGEAVVGGKAEIGVLPLSEILPIRGAELLGMFPADVQSYIVMAAGISTNSKQANTAGELIRFLTAPAALPAIKKKGMEPG